MPELTEIVIDFSYVTLRKQTIKGSFVLRSNKLIEEIYSRLNFSHFELAIPNQIIQSERFYINDKETLLNERELNYFKIKCEGDIYSKNDFLNIMKNIIKIITDDLATTFKMMEKIKKIELLSRVNQVEWFDYQFLLERNENIENIENKLYINKMEIINQEHFELIELKNNGLEE